MNRADQRVLHALYNGNDVFGCASELTAHFEKSENNNAVDSEHWIGTMDMISLPMSGPSNDIVWTSPASHQRLAGLETAFHAAPIGLCVLDLKFHYITVNSCFAKMYGLREDDFIGRSVEEALPEPASQIVAHLEDALRSDGIIEREIAFQNPTVVHNVDCPEEVVFLRTAQRVRDQAGNVIGISVAVLDITLRKGLEAALARSEEDLRHTVELTPHIPWTADATGELTFMSPRWHKITGMKPGPILLEGWAASLHPDDSATIQKIWSNSVTTGDPYDTEYRIKTPDNTWRWVRARAYPRRSPAGEIIRWYGSVEDVHDRKMTSLRLEEMTSLLERKAREDYLTGLANRRHFDDVLGRELDRARRTRMPLSLILLDVDHFKTFNDIAGHLAGDECLKKVAEALDNVIRRPADLAARFGGEEFALILPETDVAGAMTIANKALERVRTLCFEHVDPRVQHVTISAGVAQYIVGTGELRDVAVANLIEACDCALYEAKTSGRNMVYGSAAAV